MCIPKFLLFLGWPLGEDSVDLRGPVEHRGADLVWPERRGQAELRLQQRGQLRQEAEAGPGIRTRLFSIQGSKNDLFASRSLPRPMTNAINVLQACIYKSV